MDRCPEKRTGYMNTRELVLDMLMEITGGTGFSHMVMKNVLDKYDYLSGEEKSFIKRLCSGTLERRIEIDYVLNLFSNTKVNKMKPVIRNILRMGVYQILFMDGVPDAAACNEAVKLAEKRRFVQLKGFVNGVLRNVARGKQEIAYPEREKNLLLYLSVRYSMPEWLIEKWLVVYEEETVELILKGLLEEHALTIRLEEGLGEEAEEALLQAFTAAGIQAKQHPRLSYAYMLEGVEGVGRIPGFLEGKWAVMDVSSMLVAEAAGVRPGDYIVDVCAAPGGKAMHMASKLRGTGHVEARDVSEAKVDRIRENISRLGYGNMEAKVADGLVFDSALKEKADIVLADVPCSGLGVIGRKADIKDRVTAESLESLVELQRSILSVVQQYVRPGGVLLYSTCTINRAENEDMVDWITENFPFREESLQGFLPEALCGEAAGKGSVQLLPGMHGTDGFFIARLVRL